MRDAERFWEPQVSPDDEGELLPLRPPAPAAAVRAWGERTGLRLPATLAAALQAHDGGRVRGADLEIEPFGSLSVLDDDQWDDHFSPGNQEDEAYEGVDRGRLVMIGDCWGCGVVLDYTRGPEPNVVLMYHDLGGVLRNEEHGTSDAFIQSLRR